MCIILLYLNNIMKYLDISKNITVDASFILVDASNSKVATDTNYHKINNCSPEWGTMLTLQGSLNLRIGTQAWKKYISAAFWNYISTPINFTITLFTALTAGQTGTNSNYLTERQLFIMLFISFLLSIINTFFKLKEKALLNYESSKKYDEFGAKFEKIYYMSLSTETDLRTKLDNYIQLQEEINKYSQKESIENVNYFTELIYMCFHCFFEDNLKRINKTDRFWYLDGLTPIAKRTRNPWVVDMKEYFVYDISGHSIVIDEEELKERKENKRKHAFDTKYSMKNDLYDVESAEPISFRKIDKYKKSTDTISEEDKKISDIKMLFVKEKIEDCLMNKGTDETRKKITSVMLNSCIDTSLNMQEHNRVKEFLQDVHTRL